MITVEAFMQKWTVHAVTVLQSVHQDLLSVEESGVFRRGMRVDFVESPSVCDTFD